MDNVSAHSTLPLNRAAALLLLGFLFASLASASPLSCAEEEKAGSDVFVTAHLALLRETVSPNARVVARLPFATRVSLLEPSDGYLHVEVAADSPAIAKGGMRTGFLACETAAVFSADPRATAELLAAGRALAPSTAFRPLAAAFILRGAERLRSSGTPDPRAELLLGETAEALASDGGAGASFPQITPRGSGPDGKPRFVYTGDAFRRVLDLTAKGVVKDNAPLRERASAGLARTQFPQTSDSFASLGQETAGWLELCEAARTPGVLKSSVERLGLAGLALGRFLLAAGRVQDLANLTDRMRRVADRVRALAPDAKDGPRLAARAEILKAMSGDGGRPFPQECRLALGPTQITVRIDGEIGKLKLLVSTSDGKRSSPFFRRTAVPVLPVPGSLRVSPDGKSVVWVEVSKPSALLPVLASLEKDGPAREIAFLASGRPVRDRSLSHVVTTVAGFSTDSRRLGLAISAWDETPGPSPRLSVVSSETGELLFETSKDLRQFKRLLQ